MIPFSVMFLSLLLQHGDKDLTFVDKLIFSKLLTECSIVNYLRGRCEAN